jgi:4-hydroxybenzoyl-CoA reductase subunit beta
MLPLPSFQLHHPATLQETLSLLAAHPDARLIAGGTDLLPNLKHRLLEPPHLVSVRGLSPELARVERLNDGSLRVGALCTLAQVRDDATILASAAALAQAAGHVAGPQLQNMGTLGGNVMLDTRCVYYNQTLFWRQALGYCLKKDGSACHVVKGGKNCVAAHSSDTAPALLALGASVAFASPRGERVVPLKDLYQTPGDDHLRCQRDEVLTHVLIPPQPAGARSGYMKLRVRQAIDFPALNVAATLSTDADGRCASMTLFVSALGAVPKDLSALAKPYIGQPLDAAAKEALGEEARRKCVPLSSIHVDPAWRRAMVPVLVQRLLDRLTIT